MASSKALTALLADVEIFRGLSEDRLTAIARVAERMTFRAGQRILIEDEAGDAAYLIAGGTAVIVDAAAGSHAHTPLQEGTLLGEMAMLIEHAYAVTVEAQGSVRCLKLTRRAMHQLMAEDPVLTEHFVSRIAGRLTRVAVELRRIDQMLAVVGEAPRQL